jgi:hypothetical protein
MTTKKSKSAGRRTSKTAALSGRLSVGRKTFEKISAVEGINLTDDMKKTLADFDRRKLSPDARRRAIFNKFKRAGE